MIRNHRPRPLRFLAVSSLLLFCISSLVNGQEKNSADLAPTATPIKHIVVLFQENVSFDHYFGTYPFAANPKGEPGFKAADDTPRVNNLLSGGLLDDNPNSAQPFRLDRSEAWTCDQNHDYTPEQLAFDHGLMDAFVQNTGTGGTDDGVECDYGHGTGLVMGYFDGNTVTAWWNYAQHYAMSDNFYGTMFGPSSVGALNLVAGTTSNVMATSGTASTSIVNGDTSGALIGDVDPGLDDCSTSSSHAVVTSGNNIGNLLNDKNLTWGWFQGGFAPTTPASTTAKAVCGSTSVGIGGIPPVAVTDYVSHHNPFDYFESTANQHHLPPSNDSKIGETDQANHQYDLSLFFTALTEGRLPSVSFLKAKAVQNGHPGNSDPIDEQVWLTTVINAIASSPYWKDTAIIITYDDSDGWYDHQMDTVVNQSNSNDDELAAPGSCGTTPVGGNPGRCGYGPRLPFIVISPFSKQNYIDSRMTDQSSVIRFIEDNWGLGRIGGDSNDAKAGSLFGFFDFNSGRQAPRLILDPSSGLVVAQY